MTITFQSVTFAGAYEQFQVQETAKYLSHIVGLDKEILRYLMNRWKRWAWWRLPRWFNCLCWVNTAPLSEVLLPSLPFQTLLSKIISSIKAKWKQGLLYNFLSNAKNGLPREEPALLVPSFALVLTIVNCMDSDCVKAVIHMRGLSVYLPLGGDNSWSFIHDHPICWIMNQFVSCRRNTDTFILFVFKLESLTKDKSWPWWCMVVHAT